MAAAERFGVPREDVFIDCLTLTVSAQQDQAEETLAAVRTVHRDMGLQTVLGVSNISFGLPNRLLMTQTFLIRALNEGLTLPIINPNQKESWTRSRRSACSAARTRRARRMSSALARKPRLPLKAARRRCFVCPDRESSCRRHQPR